MTKKLIGEFVVTGLAGYLTGIAISHIKNNKKAKCDLIFDESSPEQTMYLKINDNIDSITNSKYILCRVIKSNKGESKWLKKSISKGKKNFWMHWD